jgi:hypothetical protein
MSFGKAMTKFEAVDSPLSHHVAPGNNRLNGINKLLPLIK